MWLRADLLLTLGLHANLRLCAELLLLGLVIDAGLTEAAALYWLDGPSRLCVRGKALWSGEDSRPAVVLSKKLLAIVGRLLTYLHLCLLGRKPLLMIDGELRRYRPGLIAARAVIAEMVVIHDRHVADVDIANIHGVYTINTLVVVEVVVVPIAALIPAAGVAEAIVDAAIKADMPAPEAAMKAIPAALVAPVAGCPERAGIGRCHPCTGYKIVAGVAIVPIARSPLVVNLRKLGLVVLRQRRWRLVGVKRVLAGIYLRIVLVVGVIISWLITIQIALIIRLAGGLT